MFRSYLENKIKRAILAWRWTPPLCLCGYVMYPFPNDHPSIVQFSVWAISRHQIHRWFPTWSSTASTNSNVVAWTWSSCTAQVLRYVLHLVFVANLNSALHFFCSDWLWVALQQWRAFFFFYYGNVFVKNNKNRVENYSNFIFDFRNNYFKLV